MITAFQSNAFQNDAFQVDLGIQYLGGDDTKYPWDRKRKKKEQYEDAAQLIERVVKSFSLPADDKVKQAQSAIQQINNLDIDAALKPRFTMSEAHIKQIQKAVFLEIQKHNREEEHEFMLLVSHLI